MAVVILEYDGRSTTAVRGLEFLMSLGIYKVKKTSRARKGLDEAIEDVNNGRVTTYSNFEEYKEGMRNLNMVACI
jgi:hypothetical protein